MWYDELFRVVGFDIITVGFVVIFGLCIGWSLWKYHKPAGSKTADHPVVVAAKCFRTEIVPEGKSAGTIKQLGASITVLLAAAVAGMALNLLSDRALDMDWVHSVRLPYPQWSADTGEMSWHHDWAPEDGIKLDAYKSVRRILILDKTLEGTKGNKDCVPWPSKEYKQHEGLAKELFQRAYLVSLAEGPETSTHSKSEDDARQNNKVQRVLERTKIQQMLAREEIFVKLIRVMLGVALILAVFSFSLASKFAHGLALSLLVVLSSLAWKVGCDLGEGWPLVLVFVPGIFLVGLMQSFGLKISDATDPTRWLFYLLSAAAIVVGILSFASTKPCVIVLLILMACVLVTVLKLAGQKLASTEEFDAWAVRVRMGTIMALLVIVLFSLWSAQSKRYYKKVFHAYLMVDEGAVPLFHEMPSCGEVTSTAGASTLPDWLY